MIINETNKPVIIFTFENTINDDNFNLLLQKWLSYYSNHNYVSFIFDTRNITKIPSLKYCFQISAFINKLKTMPVKYLRKSLILVNDSKIETLIDFILSIQKPISDVYIYKSDIEKELISLFDKFRNNEITNYRLIKCD
jgi:hypothetical protein